MALTVNPANKSDNPAGELTENDRCPIAAVGAMVIITGKLVDVPPGCIAAVTPLPVNTTDVAPVRPVPVIVALNVVPRTPVLGEIPVIAGIVAGPHSF